MKKITQMMAFLGLTASMMGVAQEKSKEHLVFGQRVPAEKIAPSGHIRCVTDEYENHLKTIHPSRESREEFEVKLKKLIAEQQAIQEVASQSGGIIYIPVVVHVIHNGDAYGVGENITDEQIQSQITVMNQDYRRMMGTPGYNTNPVGADIQVEFVLAKSDPNGNPTNGITRTNMCQAYWDMDSVDAVVKPATIWNPTLYMNMWSVNFIGGPDADILGFAQFPSNGTATANTDGVVAGYTYFGSSALASGNFSPPYDRGRTMTHEVGHFLGLYHTFQGGCAGENATSGDYCADTPAVSTPNYGCTPRNSCPTGATDMIANYMDYTDDTCMNIFTAEQKARIVAVMNSFPRRVDLKTSTKDQAIALFANDAEVLIENVCGVTPVTATCANPNPTAPASPLKKVLLYNRGTSNMTSATLSYNINGGTAYNHNWSGNLAPNKYAEITLANTAVSGTLNVSVSTVNGAADQRASNNTASKAFSGVTPLPYFNYTTFTFNLVGDAYGSETTWTLKNAAGTTLYSGGPYTNLGAAGTQNLVTNQNWNLPANGCYYLTVNDSYGDGIVGGYGNGYFTVTANGGTVSVVNNTNFTGPGGNVPTSTVHYFTNNGTLGADSFELTDEISVYPNPATTELNVKFASGFTGSFNYTIVNSIGQVVKSALVTSQDGLRIDTSGFSKGVYFIKINQDGKNKTVKFLKG